MGKLTDPILKLLTQLTFASIIDVYELSLNLTKNEKNTFDSKTLRSLVFQVF